MTKIQRIVVITFSLCAVGAGGVSLYMEFSYAALAFVFSGIASLFYIWWPKLRKKYARKRLKGRVSFNYSNNNGKYSIGSNHSELLFETKWSKASDTSIHIYNDPPSIDGVAVVKDKPNISDIRDASDHDFSSRTRTAEEGDLIILKNKYSKYAVLKVMDIKDSSRSDVIDAVEFEYVINLNGKGDFR